MANGLTPRALTLAVGVFLLCGTGMWVPGLTMFGENVGAADAARRAPRRDGTETIAKASHGLFFVMAKVNGRDVRFLVDTGATTLTLRRADAERVGLKLVAGDFDSAMMRTADGSSAMAWVRLEHVSVAGRDVAGIDAAVSEGDLPVSLLGHNLLSKLGAVTLDGDELRIAMKAD